MKWFTYRDRFSSGVFEPCREKTCLYLIGNVSQLKPACFDTRTFQSSEILDLETRDIIWSKQEIRLDATQMYRLIYAFIVGIGIKQILS